MPSDGPHKCQGGSHTTRPGVPGFLARNTVPGGSSSRGRQADATAWPTNPLRPIRLPCFATPEAGASTSTSASQRSSSPRTTSVSASGAHLMGHGPQRYVSDRALRTAQANGSTAGNVDCAKHRERDGADHRSTHDRRDVARSGQCRRHRLHHRIAESPASCATNPLHRTGTRSGLEATTRIDPCTELCHRHSPSN